MIKDNSSFFSLFFLFYRITYKNEIVKNFFKKNKNKNEKQRYRNTVYTTFRNIP